MPLCFEQGAFILLLEVPPPRHPRAQTSNSRSMQSA